MRIATTVLFVSCAVMFAAADDDANEVRYTELSIAPESYYNKDVVYEATYLSTSTTFPKYVEDSGMRANKYIMLTIGNMKLPAFVKKTDDMTKFVAGLTRGSKVKVLGKVKKFKRTPKVNVMPRYYVLIEDIEATGAAGAKPDEDGRTKQPPIRRPRAPRRRR